MRLVRWRPKPPSFTDNWRKLLQEASKFGAIGAVNTALNFAVFNLLIWTVFAHGQLKANVIATVVATTNSYLMNRHWTYRDRPKSTLRREYTLFFLFNLVGMMIELGVLGLAKYGLGTDTPLALNLAKVLALVLGMVFRFWAYRTIVFRDDVQPAPVAESALPLAPVEMPTATAKPSALPDAEDLPADGRAPAQAGKIDFDQLTVAIEAELDPPLDPAIRAELDRAKLSANRTQAS